MESVSVRNFEKPNPHIAWNELSLSVPTTAIAWPAVDHQPRLAAVSAFGFSGTNAHVIVEAPEAVTRSVSEGERFENTANESLLKRSPSLTLRVTEMALFTLSAVSAEALK